MNREDNRTYITLPPIVPASRGIPEPEPSDSTKTDVGYIVRPTHLEPPEVAWTRHLALAAAVAAMFALLQTEIRDAVESAINWTEQQNEKI